MRCWWQYNSYFFAGNENFALLKSCSIFCLLYLKFLSNEYFMHPAWLSIGSFVLRITYMSVLWKTSLYWFANLLLFIFSVLFFFSLVYLTWTSTSTHFISYVPSLILCIHSRRFLYIIFQHIFCFHLFPSVSATMFLSSKNVSLSLVPSESCSEGKTCMLVFCF